MSLRRISNVSHTKGAHTFCQSLNGVVTGVMVMVGVVMMGATMTMRMAKMEMRLELMM